MEGLRTTGSCVGTRGALGFLSRFNFQAKTVLRALAMGVMAVGALVSFDRTADAATVDGAGLGLFLGKFQGNTNPIENIQAVIDQIVDPNISGTAVFYAKVEVDDNLDNDIALDGVGPRGELSLDNVILDNDGEAFSGQWAFTPDPQFTDPVPLVTILAIKAGNFFGLWFYNNVVVTDQHGLFDVDELNLAVIDMGGSASAISHISVYGAVTVIPLPAALPLFLTALVGLGGMSYRRRKQASAPA